MTQPDDNRAIAPLLGPAEPEILCDECFERLDEYVDADLRHADADATVPGMRSHLDGCPACAEEHASLRALVQQDDAPADGSSADSR